MKAHSRIARWIFCSFAVLYIATTRGHFVGTDEVTMYQTTRSIWEEGSLATNARLPNSLPARGGGTVGSYTPAQSVAAVPFYVLGKAVGEWLRRAGSEDWAQTLGGPVIESGGSDYRWGGDVEMFFVNLFNAFVTALLVSLFFLFSMDLGATAGSALAASLLLGVATYVAPYSGGFLQHPSEAVLILAAFRFLYRDSRTPSRRRRLAAGICLSLLLLLRPQSVVAVPALAFYVVLSVRRRRQGSPARESVVRGLVPVLLPAAVAIVADVIFDQVKFGVWTRVTWQVHQPRFGLPSLTALRGFLLSPGDSVFVFTPLLLLLPWTFRLFFRRHRAEAVAVSLLAVSYLLFYSSFRVWHGLWSAMGPRYLMPMIPLLLLPLGEWIDSRGAGRAWLALAPLAVAGFFVQAVNVLTNFGFVLNHEGYPDFHPPFGFLFIPSASPIAAEVRAIVAGGSPVDMWLVNVWRGFGPLRVLQVGLPLAALFLFCVWRLRRELRAIPVRG